MSIIDENNLKDEEVFGGFEPDEDDDSFYLEVDDSLAPVITDFSDNVRELNPSENSPIAIVAPLGPLEVQEKEPEILPDNNIPDSDEVIPEQEIPVEEPIDKVVPDDMIKYEEKPEIIKEADNLQPVEEENPEPEAPETEEEPTPNSIFDELFKEPETTVHEKELIDRPFKLDDDILSLIESDLATPRRRKEINKIEIPEVSHEDNEQGLKDFQGVDNVKGAEFIDISAINAVHPSTFQNDEPLDDDYINESVQDTPGPTSYRDLSNSRYVNSVPEEEPVISKIKEKKKKRNPFLIYGSIAALLLLAAVALTAYYFFVYKGNNPFKSKSNSLIPNKTTNPVQKKSVLKNQDVSSKDTSVKVSLPLIKHDTINTSSKKQITAEKQLPVIVKQKPIVKLEPKPKKIVSVNKPKPEKKIILAENKPKVNNKVKEQRIKQTDKKKIDNKTVKPVEPVLPKTELYTIEIYSTPNVDDAEQWLSKLSKRGISASLSQQKIRGVIWYKVRYGKFTTRNEAKESAIKNGFSRSWIDRLK